MYIALDWIKDFVDLADQDPLALANRFTLSVAEVEEVKTAGAYWEMVQIVQAVRTEKHPNADKLTIVHFITAPQGPERFIVTGATNVVPGKKYPYAPLGTLLPNGLLMEPQKLRGVLSEGMFCSEDELGLGGDHHGIMELPDDAPLGQSLGSYLGKKTSTIIEVDNKSLTHRPDLWGIYGLAREFAALVKRPLKNPFDEAWMNKWPKLYTKDPSPIVPHLAGESAALGYFGLSMDGVKIEPSPGWMQERLLAVGMRPINNIVDISNYVMHELGIPLHIFDRDTIEGALEIGRVNHEETFVTLDEMQRALIARDTVIRDSKKPLVLAGIMGGLNSGVRDNTSRIFIEVANWKAAEIRATSSRLGLRTDASQRFEKALDSQLLKRTMFRTVELVLQLCPQAKIVGKLEYDGEDLTKITPTVITVDVAHAQKVLGKDLAPTAMQEILGRLDFKTEIRAGSDGKEQLIVTVPSYRATKDVSCSDDIIEELGRMIGYDNITPEAPRMEIRPLAVAPRLVLERKIKDFMALNGQSIEVMNYPLVGSTLLKKCYFEAVPVRKILNALSEETALLRPSLVPGMVQAAANNAKYYDAFKLFEVGRCYLPEDKKFVTEEDHLVVAFYDKAKNVYLDLLNTVESLLNFLAVPFEIVNKNLRPPNPLLPAEGWAGGHPYEYQDVRIMGRPQGVVLSAHPQLLGNWKMHGHLSLAVINLTNLQKQIWQPKIKYHPIAKFPASTFDWTVIAPNETPAGDVLTAATKVKIPGMQKPKIVTVFKLDEQKKAVTLRAVFTNEDGTLQTDFLNQAQSKLINALASAGFNLKT